MWAWSPHRRPRPFRPARTVWEPERACPSGLPRTWTRDLSVTLLSVGAEENGRCVVTFQGNTYLQELTLLRRQSAEIILDTTDGLRVPLAALRVATQTVTEKDPETEETASKEVNVTGVYCVSGAKARFKPVEVLLTGDDYAVVRSAGSTEKLRLRPGDEIIVAARDLYDGKVVS